jgi:hypothetical protein
VKDRQTLRASSGHFSEQPIASGRLNSVSFPAIVHSSKGIGHQAPTRVMGEAASNYVGNFRKFVSPPNVNSRSDPLNLLTLLYYGKIHMYLTLLKAFTSKTINSLFSSQHSYFSRVPKTFDCPPMHLHVMAGLTRCLHDNNLRSTERTSAFVHRIRITHRIQYETKLC